MELTFKQRKWLKYFIESGNATEAARAAGYNCKSEENFRYIGYQNYTKLHISDFMEEQGLSDVTLLKSLISGPVEADHKTKLEYLKLALKRELLRYTVSNLVLKDKKVFAEC